MKKYDKQGYVKLTQNDKSAISCKFKDFELTDQSTHHNDGSKIDNMTYEYYGDDGEPLVMINVCLVDEILQYCKAETCKDGDSILKDTTHLHVRYKGSMEKIGREYWSTC